MNSNLANDAVQESVVMGFDAMRICMGDKPKNRPVHEVIAWFNLMAQTCAAKPSDLENAQHLLDTVMVNLKHDCPVAQIIEWHHAERQKLYPGQAELEVEALSEARQLVWPAGCAKNSSCARNHDCMYNCEMHARRPRDELAAEIIAEKKRRGAI